MPSGMTGDVLMACTVVSHFVSVVQGLCLSYVWRICAVRMYIGDSDNQRQKVW